MGKYNDITGQKFGRLTALYRLHNTKGRTKWLCVCECGNLKEVRLDMLQSCHTKSCNCLYKKSNAIHGKYNTRLYNTWRNMKSRCYYTKNINYKNYGERGIKVCDEWKNDFKAFYDWAMSNGYDDNLTIDRIDVNGNYEPNNCCWITHKEQQQNKQNSVKYTINGKTHCLKKWCEICGIKYTTVRKRLELQWTIMQALELEERK